MVGFRIARRPDLGAFLKGNRKKTDRFVERVAFEVERRAKMLAPVDTGRLRASIRTGKLKPRNYSVSTQVDYGPHVEFGTRIWQGKPFLRPATDSVRKTLKDGRL